MSRAAFSLLLAVAAAQALGAPAAPNLERVESLVIEGTNRFRQGEGLGTVVSNARLDEAARAFANYLADSEQLAHEAGGSTPEGRIRARGYQSCLVAENLARYYDSGGFTTQELAQRLVQGWKDSPAHRENMVTPDARDTAVAVVHRRRKGVEDFYAVQLFARQASTRVRFQVHNATGAELRYRVDGREFKLPNRWWRQHEVCGERVIYFDRGQFRPVEGDRFTATADAVTRGRAVFE